SLFFPKFKGKRGRHPATPPCFPRAGSRCRRQGGRGGDLGGDYSWGAATHSRVATIPGGPPPTPGWRLFLGGHHTPCFPRLVWGAGWRPPSPSWLDCVTPAGRRSQGRSSRVRSCNRRKPRTRKGGTRPPERVLPKGGTLLLHSVANT